MQGYEFDKREFMEYMRRGEELYMAPDPEVQVTLGPVHVISTMRNRFVCCSGLLGRALTMLQLLHASCHISFRSSSGAFLSQCGYSQIHQRYRIGKCNSMQPETAAIMREEEGGGGGLGVPLHLFHCS